MADIFFFAVSRVRTNLQLCPKKKIKLKQTNSTHKHLMEASNEGKSHLMAMKKKNRRKNLTCASEFCSESNWYKVGKSGNHSAWKVANVSSALIARNPTDSFICTKLIWGHHSRVELNIWKIGREGNGTWWMSQVFELRSNFLYNTKKLNSKLHYKSTLWLHIQNNRVLFIRREITQRNLHEIHFHTNWLKTN